MTVNVPQKWEVGDLLNYMNRDVFRVAEYLGETLRGVHRYRLEYEGPVPFEEGANGG